MKSSSKNLFLGFSLVLSLVLLSSFASAEIDWSKMTDEEIRAEIKAGQTELFSRNSGALELGKSIAIESEYGTYLFTIDDAHILTSDDWMRKADKRNKETVCISVRGVVNNIDYRWFNDFDYIPNYQIQQDMIVADQDNFSLEVYDVSNGEDGRYEVGAHTSPGEKKRVSLVFYGFTDTTSITISFKGYDGLVTIPLK